MLDTKDPMVSKSRTTTLPTTIVTGRDSAGRERESRVRECESVPPNAVVQLQAHYHHCGVAASEKCLSAATFVRQARRIVFRH